MNTSKIYVEMKMKTFSQYILEGVENWKKIFPYIVNQIISFCQLKDVIKNTNDESLIDEYNNLLDKYAKLLNIEQSKLLTITDANKEITNKTFGKFGNDRKQKQFIDGFKNIDVEKFTNIIGNLSKNESLNESEDELKTVVDKLKNVLNKNKEKYKDIDVPDNFYAIGIKLIDNYDAFGSLLDDKAKDDLKEKMEKIISQLDDESDSNSDSNNDNDTPEETKETIEKVLKSDTIDKIKKDIKEIDNINEDDLYKAFNKYATDDIKENPEGNDYLGLMMITLGGILLKQKTDKYKTHIQDITKKDNA